ncbi:YT521-B-like domain-containing protein [Aspergillus unguis]
MDGGPKAAREAKGKNRAPSESGQPTDPGGAPRQSRPTFYRQSSRPENVQNYPQSHPYMTPVGNYGHPGSMSGMGNTATALPGYPSGPIQFDQQGMQQQPQPQQFVQVAPSSGLMYGMPQFQSFPAPATNPNMMYNAPYPQMYMPYVQQQQRHPGAHISGFSPITPTPPSPGSVQSPMDAYAQSYFHQNMYAAPGHHSRPTNTSFSSPQPLGQNQQKARKSNEDGGKEDKKRLTIVDGSTHMKSSSAQGSSAGNGKLNEAASIDSTPRSSKSNVPKGPPRKPKQSGNALWVGNLAPGTSIVELKDHFSQDATQDLESVFLISRSNCAFVNYKSEEACIKALSRFHDTRLRGARLVCRVRRGLMSPGPHSELTGLADPSSIKEAEDMMKLSSTEDEGREGSYLTRVPNRYFVLKSLTIEDLEISWQSGIWATQTHNEETLNRAFENADNVYLFFSANKSGEYYGYARMMSTIKEDESLTLEMPPRSENHPLNEPDSPDVTPTPASTSAPNGRIINDVARGTIFWEADTSEDEEGGPRPQKSAYQAPGERQQQAPAELQLIGKPFRIRWLSTEKVPFHRTRGLRNPWNANREVKIARDGTELEFPVGEKLVLLFHPEASG